MKGAFRTTVGCALLALAIMPLTASSGQEAGTATSDKEGWWSRTGRAVPTELPDTVPAGAIGVAAEVGEPVKVAAIGIVLDAAKGSTVEAFTLTMKEAEGTGAQQNADGAVIIACPIIDFFAGDANGRFEDAPAADCEAAQSEGQRNDDGTWTFDLAPLANAWLDPFGTIGANGIRFDPGDATFQVSFTGMEDAVFDVALTPPQEESDPFDSVTTTVPGGFAGSAPPAGGVETEPPPAVETPDSEGAREEPATGGADEASGPAASEGPAASRAGDVAGNLPVAVLLVLVLAAAGAVLIALGLGPAGRHRSTTSRRSGGVSRALEARTTHGARP